MGLRNASQFSHTAKQIEVYCYLSSSVILFIVIIIIYYFYFRNKSENTFTPREGGVCGVVHWD
jgi:heme/copper-type cytochrome/quinol oxidase subunit 3